MGSPTATQKQNSLFRYLQHISEVAALLSRESMCLLLQQQGQGLVVMTADSQQAEGGEALLLVHPAINILTDLLSSCGSFALQGQYLAVMTVNSKWAPNKPKEAKHCYGTTSIEHPAVQMISMERGKYYIGAFILPLICL